MSIPEWFLKLGLFPGVLAGVTLPQWLRLLWDNQFLVEPRFWPRAGIISLTSAVNSLVGSWEQLAYSRRWNSIDIPPPVIVLGAARSGTTHLHTLLTTDHRFGYLTLYQGRFPHTFLLTETWARRVLSGLILPTRFQDNVSMDFDSPAEDDDALCVLCPYSPRLRRVFGRRPMAYDRFSTLEGFSDTEARRWKAAFATILRKLTLRYGRPLVLKSPSHTSKIPLLLDVVPQAKFVFIHRDPGDVLRSARHMERAMPPVAALQTLQVRPDEQLVSRYCAMMNGYFLQRSLIPRGNLIEVGYDQVVRDPMDTIRRIYSTLELADFSKCEPQLRAYVQSIADYRKNRHAELPAELRQQAANECPQWFDEWDYAP